MVEQGRIAGTLLGLGTHTVLGATGGIVPLVLQQFIAVHTQKLAGRPTLQPLEPMAQRPRQGASLYTRTWVGSILSAAPIDEKKQASVRHAISMSSTLSFSESMASMM